MFDADIVFKDQLMGEVKISLQDFADGKEHDKWFPLANEPVKKKIDKTQGEIHLKLFYMGPVVKPDKTNKDGSKHKHKHKDKDDKHKHDGEKKEDKQKDDKSNSTPSTKDNDKKDKAVVEPVVEKPPKTIEEKYDMGKIIGKGAFSVVRIASRKTNGKKYAIKCISKKTIQKSELTLLEREMDIMKKLQHPNIIQLMEVLDTADTLFLVLEFAEGGELFDAIVNRGFYSESDAAKIVYQILDAILYTHNHGIAHRDLKPENLLIAHDDGKELIKIADFGLSKEFGAEQMMTSCGTPDYVAPEVLSGEVYASGVDIWSIGVITYVLLCGFPPFFGETQKELFDNILSATFDFPNPEWKGVSTEAKNFISKMLVVDPDVRYSAEQCLQDPWITDNITIAPKKDLKRLETFSVAKFKAYQEKYKNNNPQNTTYAEKYTYKEED